MKKKVIIGSMITILFVAVGIGLFLFLRVKYAKVIVNLVDNLTIPVGSKAKLSDFIQSMNGTLIDDFDIDTKEIGEKNIEFTYKNDDHIKVKYSFQLSVVDLEEPIAWLSNTYTVTTGAREDFYKKIMCADNYDPNPTCEVVGEYDMNTPGTYPLTFQATDQSGNRLSQKFTLRVIDPPKNTTPTTPNTPSKTIFSDVVDTYKTENTEIGLDISHWQGEVDFNAIKESGAEFVIIRVGTSKGIGEENVLDSKFIQNIEGATAEKIPVGLYFYSYADSEERAKKDAEWVLDQIKGYNIELPIAFDWENWNSYNEFHLSLMGLSNAADTFLKTIENAGYQGMLYSSKSYLEKIWYPTSYKTWLAHYTNQTNYQGDYEFWQLCSDGVINGINGAVDIDIRYKN